jgi:hypothetical protein
MRFGLYLVSGARQHVTLESPLHGQASIFTLREIMQFLLMRPVIAMRRFLYLKVRRRHCTSIAVLD